MTTTSDVEATQPVDLRLLPAAVGAEVGAALGLVVSGRACLVLVVGALVGGLVAVGRSRAGRGSTWPAVACLLLVLAGGLGVAGLRVESRRSGPVAALAAEQAAVQVVVVLTGDPRPTASAVSGDALRRPTLVAEARLERVTGSDGRSWRVRQPVLLIAPSDRWIDLLPSQRVTTSGKLVPPDGHDLAAVVLVRGRPDSVGPPSLVQREAGRLRGGLRTATAHLPTDPRGLLPGLVLGDTSAMTDDLRDDARTAGLSHLTAVSGANCAIVLAVVLGLVKPLGRRGRSVAAAFGLLGFVVLARPSPSVLRAALMGLIALLALALGRPRVAVPALLGSVTLLVLLDPDLALQPGFVLSVLATGSLLVIVPGWAEALSARMPSKLAQIVAVPLAAQAAVTPVIVLLSGSISLVSVPANLLAAPAVPPATILGILVTVLAPVSPGAASRLASAAGLPVAWIAAVAHHSAHLPHASLGWPTGLIGVLLAIAAVLAAVAVVRRRRWRRVAVAVLAGLLLAGVLLVPRTVEQWPPPGWQLVACDVGQGDSLMVRGSANDLPVLVDAGPDPRAMRRCLDELKVRRLAAVVLSHLHADHVEGLPAVLGRVPAPAVFVNPLDEPALEGRRVRGWAQRARVPVSVLTAGQAWSAGGVAFDVLGPSPVLHGTDSDPNNDSLVLLARLPGLRVLLTGDVEPEGQANLLARGVPQVDVLKVPHHGSAHQDDRFLQASGARVSLTSVGAGNPYGHPAVRTLTALAEDDITNLRTDTAGSIAVRGSSAGPVVVPQRKSPPGRPEMRAAAPSPKEVASAREQPAAAATAGGPIPPNPSELAAVTSPPTVGIEARARSPC